MGADDVIDYTTQDVTKTLLDNRPRSNGTRKYDLYIDCVGGVEMFEHWVQFALMLLVLCTC
jgi:NADPH-dependent curcumin reductase CurA